MILLLREDAPDPAVQDVLAEVRTLGLEAQPLDDGRGRVFEILGEDRGRALRLRDRSAVADVLSRRIRTDRGEPLWPHFTLRILLLALALLVGLSLLVVVAPPGLAEEASATGGTGPETAEWYLKPLEGLLALVPEVLGYLLVGLFWLLLFAWPFLDRTDTSTPRGARVAKAMQAMGLLLLLFLVFLAWSAP